MQNITQLHILQALGVALAYLIAMSALVHSGKVFKFATYFVFIFAIHLFALAMMPGFVYSLATVLLTVAYLSFGYGWLGGLAHGLTIYVALQWVAAFVGSMVAIITYHGQFTADLTFLSIGAVVFMAAVLKIYQGDVFKNPGKVGIGVKLAFVLLVQGALPGAYAMLGTLPYYVLVVSVHILALTGLLVYANPIKKSA